MSHSRDPVEVFSNSFSKKFTSELGHRTTFCDVSRNSSLPKMNIAQDHGVPATTLLSWKQRDAETGSISSDGCDAFVTVNLDHLTQAMFMEVFNTKFGPTEAFQSFQFSSISHGNAYLDPGEDGAVEIILETVDSAPVELNAVMDLYRTEYKASCDRCILKSKQGPRTRFTICFLVKGVYVLRIFASAAEAEKMKWDEKIPASKGSINVFNYLVSVKNPRQFGFPRSFPQWNSIDSVLIEPLFDSLPSHSSVKFVVKVAGAEQVAVAAEGDMVALERDFRDFWRQSVTTGAFGSQLNLYAKFSDDPDAYTLLLRYTVVKSSLDHTFDKMVKLEEEILRQEMEKLSDFRKNILRKVTPSDGFVTPPQVIAEQVRIKQCLVDEKKRLRRTGKHLKPHQLKDRGQVEQRKRMDLEQAEERHLLVLSQMLNCDHAERRKVNEHLIETLEHELKLRLVEIEKELDDIMSEIGWTKKQLRKRKEAHQHLMDELHTVHCQMVAEVRRHSERYLEEVATRNSRALESLKEHQVKMFSELIRCQESVFFEVQAMYASRMSETTATSCSFDVTAPPSKATTPSPGKAPTRSLSKKAAAAVSRTEQRLRMLKLTKRVDDGRDDEKC